MANKRARDRQLAKLAARRQAERILHDASRKTTAELAALPVMARGRGDVIVAGAVVLVAVMQHFGMDRALVSETDILDGLALARLVSL